jgi:hypothetical protein
MSGRGTYEILSNSCGQGVFKCRRITFPNPGFDSMISLMAVCSRCTCATRRFADYRGEFGGLVVDGARGVCDEYAPGVAGGLRDIRGVLSQLLVGGIVGVGEDGEVFCVVASANTWKCWLAANGAGTAQ